MEYEISFLLFDSRYFWSGALKINGRRIDSIHLNLHGSINDTRLNAAKCSLSEECYFPKTSQQSTPYKPVELAMEMVAELENVLKLIESVDILI